MTTTRSQRNAVIIGGSMAGLAAARVLSEHFERVTIVERDLLPAEPEHRPGVPQSFQNHFLIAQGRRVYEQLFPGLDETLAAAGAPLIDIAHDGHLAFGPGLLKRVRSQALVRCATRIRLEWEVRRRVASLPNVRILDGVEVVSLRANSDRARIEGVLLQPRAQDRGDVPASLDADLVVEASGRRSRAPDWLRALGYAEPEVINVDGHASYSTRLYERIELPEGTGGLFVFGRVPDVPRIGAVVPVEGGRSMVFIGGIGKQDAAPTEDKAYLEFARTLIDPIIYEHLRHAKPLGKALGYRQADNQWRQYAALSRMPDRFVPIGDSICAFNPIYGQGMTVAGLQARALGDEISAGGLDGIALRAQRAFKRTIAPAWLFATGEDYRWSTTEGPPMPPASKITHAYVDYVFDMALIHPEVGARLIEVGQMLEPVTALFAPRILLYVLSRVLRGEKPSAWGKTAAVAARAGAPVGG